MSDERTLEDYRNAPSVEKINSAARHTRHVLENLPAQGSALLDVVKAVGDLLDAWPVDDSGVPVIEPEALVDAIGVEVVALVKAYRALSVAGKILGKEGEP